MEEEKPLRKPVYIYKAKCKRVIDGDTFDAIVDVGFYISVHQRIRLKGVDAPEIFGVSKNSREYKQGIRAKKYLEWRFFENNNECILETHRTGKYGRWIAVVWLQDSNVSLNQELLDKKLVVKIK